jgi:hypothetical protein
MEFTTRSDGMIVTLRDGVEWCIDEHQQRFIVWCGTEVAGYYHKLETAKASVVRGLKMVVDESS